MSVLVQGLTSNALLLTTTIEGLLLKSAGIIGASGIFAELGIPLTHRGAANRLGQIGDFLVQSTEQWLTHKGLAIQLPTSHGPFSQLEGVDLEMYKEVVLPRVLEQVVNCKESVEDVSTNLNLKRSRPLSPLHVTRVLSIDSSVDSKVGVLGTEGSNSLRGDQCTTFDLPSPPTVDMLPLKFIKTGDNTKALFQKPSTIFMPTAKLGGIGLPILEAPIVPLTLEPSDVAPSSLPAAGTALKPSSPKKRPNRSRRERNRRCVHNGLRLTV